MELRQLKYFLKVVECGSMGKAALELGVGTSALSQQLTRLERELSTQLLNRKPTGALPTAAGIAFMNHAQLAVRQAEQAVTAAQSERASGYVSIGLPPTTASILAMPVIRAMKEHYPQIQLHIVESLSGHLATLLNSRQIDLALVFHADGHRRWHTKPLLDENLFFISSLSQPFRPTAKSVHLKELTNVELIMPSDSHGLRSHLIAAFERLRVQPNIVMEIDGLALLMDAVREGHGATIQPGAAAARLNHDELCIARIVDKHVGRRNLLVSLPGDELSPSALATRTVIANVAQQLAKEGRWPGANLIHE